MFLRSGSRFRSLTGRFFLTGHLRLTTGDFRIHLGAVRFRLCAAFFLFLLALDAIGFAAALFLRAAALLIQFLFGLIRFLAAQVEGRKDLLRKLLIEGAGGIQFLGVGETLRAKFLPASLKFCDYFLVLNTEKVGDFL